MGRHKSVTLDRVEELVLQRRGSLDNPGICFACGAETEGVEPDAVAYECELCEEMQVYGVEEALMMLALE